METVDVWGQVDQCPDSMQKIVSQILRAEVWICCYDPLSLQSKVCLDLFASLCFTHTSSRPTERVYSISFYCNHSFRIFACQPLRLMTLSRRLSISRSEVAHIKRDANQKWCKWQKLLVVGYPKILPGFCPTDLSTDSDALFLPESGRMCVCQRAHFRPCWLIA